MMMLWKSKHGKRVSMIQKTESQMNITIQLVRCDFKIDIYTAHTYIEGWKRRVFGTCIFIFSPSAKACLP